MPGLYDNDDEDYGQEQSGPKALRDQLAKVQKALDQANKDLEAERKTSADLANKVKTTTLRDALTDAGIDPKYARFAERDEVEANVESVKKWVAENKDVYAFLNTRPAPDGDDDGDEGQEQTDEIDPDLEAGIASGQRIESAGRPSGSTNIVHAIEGTDVSTFKTREELEKHLASLGVPLS